MPSNHLVKPFDILIIVLLCVVLVAISIMVYSGDEGLAMVEIKTAETRHLYPLDEDRQLTVSGPLGDTVIEIKNRQVRILASPCRGKLCIQKGALENNGDWSACLPNRVYVTIEKNAEEGLDGLSH